jgi:dTDP-4-dehydrorhamnose reductase
MISDAKRAPRGTLHLAGCNAISRYEQAQEILSCAARFGFPNFNCIPITTAVYGAIARRPLNAVLDTDKAEKHSASRFASFP